ncbi:MAG TPA: TetR/AcrR family transcriptional regulator [Candidatus Corynebacterium gallistercoris]|uniref:TetR/AcrR family transcriptional regulator n=1 Tax=Candidatus Corynebacterium gallistercoris TaxID=2838530 RepID=A0A9D1UQC9_9CORY|nr:TetR/AcrR family transcriptional regulator [Candidatus Corynebacterium gallistercoris]
MSDTYPSLPDVTGMSQRAAAKAQRRVELLNAAAAIMAAKGFHGTRLEDIGEAVGISGPAVYRHFPSKEVILEELLTGISEHLLAESKQMLAGIDDPRDQLEILIDFHVNFAITKSELIRLHQRELFRLDATGLERVRTAQGRYLRLWAKALQNFDASFQAEAGRITAQLVTGMINASQNTSKWAGEALLRRQMTLCARAAVGLR